MSWFNKHRANSLNEIVGQNAAVTILQGKLKGKEFPHTVLLSGPSGSGKTTIARIIPKELGCTCTMPNLTEVNCADVRGIDSVRDIGQAMHLGPMGGTCRVWIFDEIVQLPKTTQQAFLKILEDPPKKAYFILCASDLTSLLPTFMSRCFHVVLNQLSYDSIKKILVDILNKEHGECHSDVINVIANKCNGNARLAIQLLEACMEFSSTKERMEAVNSGILPESESESLAKSLFAGKSWGEIAATIDKLEQKDLESIRYGVLGYASKVLAFGKEKQKARRAIKAFKDSFQWSGKAGMMLAADTVVNNTEF